MLLRILIFIRGGRCFNNDFATYGAARGRNGEAYKDPFLDSVFPRSLGASIFLLNRHTTFFHTIPEPFFTNNPGSMVVNHQTTENALDNVGGDDQLVLNTSFSTPIEGGKCHAI